MASSVSMAMPMFTASHKNLQPPTSDAYFKPLPVKPSKVNIFTNSSKSRAKLLQTQASLKEKAITGLTAAAITAYMVVPDVAQAAGSDLSPSLKNFLLSIVAGGVVLAALFGAVIGVANFDPVKRS